MPRWKTPYGHCPICGRELDEGLGPIFSVYHEWCLPRCDRCGGEIRADLCEAVWRAMGGKWAARHKGECPA